MQRETHERPKPTHFRSAPAGCHLVRKHLEVIEVGNCTVVMGRVVHAAIDESVLVDGHPEIELLRPLSRLGKQEWGTAGEIREITRIPHDEWPGHYGS